MGSTGRDKSLKPVDTGYRSNLEQESVIACGFTTSHAEKVDCLLAVDCFIILEIYAKGKRGPC